MYAAFAQNLLILMSMLFPMLAPSLLLVVYGEMQNDIIFTYVYCTCDFACSWIGNHKLSHKKQFAVRPRGLRKIQN